jgi:hypothetical protein
MSDIATPPTACPELPDLVLAVDEELPGDQLQTIRAHLRSCSTCREIATDIRLAVSALRPSQAELQGATVRYDLFRKRLDAEVKGRPALFHSFALRRWLPVAASVLLCAAAFLFSNRLSPTVQADELLARAVAQERVVPTNAARRFQVTLEGFAPNRPLSPLSPELALGQSGVVPNYSVFKETGGVHAPTNGLSAEAESELTQVFAKHGFNWDDPLNVVNFTLWRAAVPSESRIDTVDTRDPKLIALQTRTSFGDLVEARIVLRANDYRAVAQSWLFADQRRIDIREVEALRPNPAFPAALAANPIAAQVDTPVNGERLERTELRARRLLHDSKADLDPSLIVRRSIRHVEVHGLVSREAYAQLSKELSDLSDVRPELSPANSGDAVTAGAGAPKRSPSSTDETNVPYMAASTPLSPSMERWLKRRFGARDAGAVFLPKTLDDLRELERRGRAWRDLGRRYPPEVVGRLSSGNRSELSSLVEAHYADLANTLNTVERRLALFLGTTTRVALPEHAGADWQARANEVAAESSRLLSLFQGLTIEETNDLAMPDERTPEAERPVVLTDLAKSLDRVWALCSAQSVDEVVSGDRH